MGEPCPSPGRRLTVTALPDGRALCAGVIFRGSQGLRLWEPLLQAPEGTMDGGQEQRFPWFHRDSWEEGGVMIPLNLVLQSEP